MQNVVNLLCPFFRNRLPIVGGKVYFVKPTTTAQNFTQVAGLDFANYVAIYDKNHVLLENPLPLNEEGCFETQPFVNDGVEYKMIVCYPTGLPALLNDETPCWEVAYTIDSKTGSVEIHYDGVACVDSIYELAELDPDIGCAVVRGYASANDFCPPRLFEWVQGETNFNVGTHIRSTERNNGAWCAEPSGFVDVRWFGVNPDSNGADYTATIIGIAEDYPTIPIYFPSGSYYLSSHVVFMEAIAERQANFYPASDVTYDLKFEVKNMFDNRGVRFWSNTNACVVYPKIKGVLHTSCFPSPANAALSESALADVDEIVIDSNIALENGSEVTVNNRKVLVKKNALIPDGLKFGSESNVYYEKTGLIAAKMMRLLDWFFRDEELAGDVHELQVSKTGGDTLFSLSLLETFIAKIVHMCSGFWLQKNPNVDEPDHVNSWEKVNGEYMLRAEHAALTDLAAVNGIVTNEFVANLQVNKIARLDDTVTVEVDGGLITYAFNPLQYIAYQNNTVPMEAISSMFPNAALINVLLAGYNSNEYKLILPHEDKDVAFYVYNPHHKKIDIQEDVTFAFVEVYGHMFNVNDDAGVSRLYLRNPTAAERTRFAIPDNVHWIIDPSVL